MDIRQHHQDVAAYALGVLEPGDAFRFEDHLADCGLCVLELSGFASVAAAMAELSEPGVPLVQASPGLLDRLTRDVARSLRRSRHRRLRLAAAAAALIVVLPAAVWLVRAGLDADGLDGPGLRVTATNASTGVTASAVVEDRAWGTAVALRLSGVEGPGSCRLIAVGADGVERPVLSWRVPAKGHGTASGGAPLVIEGGTDLPSHLIGRWEVRDANGRTLVALGG
ncbi:hypothetical protein ACFQ61_06650 [Streptomyces sp. NPDC056500]|uniref:hypothetical protein n=1 Tax=Streptomyces sp. NPDC056500 TaxID=3345840 RepID=UPI0036A6B51E